MGSESSGVSLPAIAEEGGITEENLHVDIGSSYAYGDQYVSGYGTGIGALRNEALPGEVQDTAALLPQDDRQSGPFLKSLSGLADTVYGVRSRSSTRASQQYQYIELQDQSEGAAAAGWANSINGVNGVNGVNGASHIPDSV